MYLKAHVKHWRERVRYECLSKYYWNLDPWFIFIGFALDVYQVLEKPSGSFKHSNRETGVQTHYMKDSAVSGRGLLAAFL